MESNINNLATIVNNPVNEKYEPLRANNPIEILKEQMGYSTLKTVSYLAAASLVAAGTIFLFGSDPQSDTVTPVYVGAGAFYIAALMIGTLAYLSDRGSRKHDSNSE